MKTDTTVEKDTDTTEGGVSEQDDTASSTTDDKATGKPNTDKTNTDETASVSDTTTMDADPSADETADEDSTASSGGDGGRPARKSTRFRWGAAGVAVLAVVAIAASALAVVFGVQLKNRIDIENAGQEALRTAESYAVALTSIDTRNLDRDFARVLEGATGEFKDMYSSSSSQLRQLLVDNQATGKGTVIDAGIRSQSENKVEVMLFVDQTVTNTASPDPRLDRSRILMTMEKVDGRWLACKVELP